MEGYIKEKNDQSLSYKVLDAKRNRKSLIFKKNLVDNKVRLQSI
jgi:hypothetical protein